MNGPDHDIYPVRIGVSRCLLGENVRWDGGHKRDPWLLNSLGPYVRFVGFCPEVEVGLGVPRPPVRLVDVDGDIRMLQPKTGRDVTAAMSACVADRLKVIAGERLCGYVLKSKSPSCGMDRVKIYRANGNLRDARGRGLFGDALQTAFPHLPVEDEGRLHDPPLRENFISRIFAYARWRRLEDEGFSRGGLMRFHQAHKLVLMAHNQAGARRLGKLLGDAGKKDDPAALAATYLDAFMAIMARPANRRNHVNVLQHMAGYVSGGLDADDRHELTEIIGQYHQGLLPLIVPVTLIRHYVRRQGVAYLADQVYLYPHPHELMLLNQL